MQVITSMGMKNTPHDELFKHIMGNPKTAKNFIKEYLPGEILDNVDLSELKDKTQDYTDEKLDNYRTDLVYRSELESGREAYFYFLFEHKSSPDRDVVFQLLRYMTLIWERAGREEAEYPLVLPILFYHGSERDEFWPYGDSLSDVLTEVPGWASDITPYFDYFLFDFNHMAESDPDDPRLNAYFRLLETAWAHNKRVLIRKVLNLIERAEVEYGRVIEEDYERVFQYVSVAVDFSHRDMQEVVEKETPERREDYMTIAEELREEGKTKAFDVLMKLKDKFGEKAAFDLAAKIKDKDLEELDRIESSIDEVENIEQLRKKIK